jgi:hypothetical protein
MKGRSAEQSIPYTAIGMKPIKIRPWQLQIRCHNKPSPFLQLKRREFNQKGIHTAITEEESIILDELRMRFPMMRKLYEFSTQKNGLFMHRYESYMKHSFALHNRRVFI